MRAIAILKIQTILSKNKAKLKCKICQASKTHANFDIFRSPLHLNRARPNGTKLGLGAACMLTCCDPVFLSMSEYECLTIQAARLCASDFDLISETLFFSTINSQLIRINLFI